MTSNSDDDKSNDSTGATPQTQALFPFPNFTPRQFLLLTTIPLSLGTYIGYKRALKQVATDKRTVAMERAAAQAPFLASRALLIGTCASVAGVGLLCTGIMHLAGVDSAESLMNEFRRVGRTYAAPMLDSMRIDDEKSRKAQKDLDRDRQLVQEMSEDEEIEFWKKKYFGDDGKADDEAPPS
mmetsp:Transcript_14674/g.22725  ORF Transcript_14674/g.22725 Transcript_14674/m.22725 type:complete len:182 (-) Transcript_14674:621-1166(-)|eukprot:CAMPEP_0196820300 /NCGR_PEP_ID=MMETSP1362-20130617/74686_1 /TAXON_ID=163516 /ORGANISM="Leptocylindrus danicus, Strain CCMP1856" /LENGTH=181 /DNA_ID=CAMNT_0042199129 /DNA_START=42 /DNA_END=587 /DNA_ORIENTATION=-